MDLKNIKNYQYFILYIIILFFIFIFLITNILTMNKVNKLEHEKSSLIKIYEDKKKLLEKTLVEYDNNLDFNTIKSKMEKNGMVIADENLFFEIEE